MALMKVAPLVMRLAAASGPKVSSSNATMPGEVSASTVGEEVAFAGQRVATGEECRTSRERGVHLPLEGVARVRSGQRSNVRAVLMWVSDPELLHRVDEAAGELVGHRGIHDESFWRTRSFDGDPAPTDAGSAPSTS